MTASEFLQTKGLRDLCTGTINRTEDGGIILNPSGIFVSQLMEYWAKEKAARIAELEAALDGIIDYAQEHIDDDEAQWGTYRKERRDKMRTDVQRARDALAKETL
jgi:hypothetical protein